MLKKLYSCDITREQYEIIRPIIESVKKNTKPPIVDKYLVFCAILYVLKTGCQWENLPKDYPNYKIVYFYYRQWKEIYKDTEQTTLDRILSMLVGEERKNLEREENTTFLLIDSQSVKNTDTAKEKGYDGGKKVSGIKRFIAVDINGFPIAMHITTADIGERAGAIEMFKDQIKRDKAVFSRIINVSADGGFFGKPFAKAIFKLIGSTVKVVKRIVKHVFKVLENRWIVERSFAWLEKNRRLWKNCERTLSSSRAMVQLAFISLILRRKKA